MIIVLSPSKKQSDIPLLTAINKTIPLEIDKALFLINHLKLFSVDQLSTMMKISLPLAKSTHNAIHHFSNSTKNNISAIELFQGDAFQKLAASTLDKNDLDFAQHHLIIFSALYGYVRPFDAVQPYRLDMKDTVLEGINLYDYWKDIITSALNNLLSHHENKIILNLASDEYIKVVDHKKLSGKIILVDFKVRKNKEYKTVGIYAKRGRGLLARYIIKEKLDTPESIVNFKAEGFEYSTSLSTPKHYVFVM